MKTGRSSMRTFTWTIHWSNPHTKPPDGKPEVLLSITRMVRSSADTPKEIKEFPTIGTGYAIFCRCEDALQPPKRRMSEEVKQRLRRTRLIRRLENRAPLFAKDLYAEEINAKPEYYGNAEPQET